MNIMVVCQHCRHYDKEPAIEINFRDQAIYYICVKCKKESKIDLNIAKASNRLPRSRSL